MNKTIAGYHLLMILSAVDFKVARHEDKIIRIYLEQEFPIQVNLDREMAIISNLKKEEWQNNGSLKAILEIPAAARPNVIDRLGSITKGSATVEIMK